MDMPFATIWWIAAGVAVAAELATGSVYLLMIALGLAAGALAAWFGLVPAAQVLVAALLGGGATAAWHRYRDRQPGPAAARENRDVNIDIGDAVSVATWAADRTARVSHSGSEWTARLAPGAPVAGGLHRVVAVEGNWLVLAPAAPIASAGA